MENKINYQSNSGSNENAALKNPQIVQPMPVIASAPMNMTLPFDVKNDLNMFSKITIVRQYNLYRTFHCMERLFRDYQIHGELPDGDKKILFTVNRHFECCKCCQQCIIPFYCLDFVCCNSIIFQLDYKRNEAPFYTQGINLQRGVYCCKCLCCYFCPCCMCSNTLHLRENIDPDSRDFNVGVKKGSTKVPNTCCLCKFCCCFDKKTDYYTQEGLKGQTVRAKCCDILVHQCLYNCCYGFTYDFEMDIENESGVKTGKVMIYSGCYSQKTEGKTCYYPAGYYDIFMPPGATSEQKFQIIADLIHFDVFNNVI